MIWWDGELWLVGDERGGPIGVICLENTMAQLKGVNGVNDGVNGVICTDYLLIDLPEGGAPPPGVGVGSIPASGVLPKISSVGKGARVNDVNVQKAKEQVTSLTGRPWEAGKQGKLSSKAGAAAEDVDEVMRKRSTGGRGTSKAAAYCDDAIWYARAGAARAADGRADAIARRTSIPRRRMFACDIFARVRMAAVSVIFEELGPTRGRARATTRYPNPNPVGWFAHLDTLRRKRNPVESGRRRRLRGAGWRTGWLRQRTCRGASRARRSRRAGDVDAASQVESRAEVGKHCSTRTDEMRFYPG